MYKNKGGGHRVEVRMCKVQSVHMERMERDRRIVYANRKNLIDFFLPQNPFVPPTLKFDNFTQKLKKLMHTCMPIIIYLTLVCVV